MKWEHSYLNPHTKTNSNWIKDLNIKTKPIKLLENIMVNLDGLTVDSQT